mgnify:FL=1
MYISPPSQRQMLDSARTSFASKTMLAAQARGTNREFPRGFGNVVREDLEFRTVRVGALNDGPTEK